MKRKVVKNWVQDLHYSRYLLSCGHVVVGNRARWLKGVLTEPKKIDCKECT